MTAPTSTISQDVQLEEQISIPPTTESELQGRKLKYGCCTKSDRLVSAIFISLFTTSGFVFSNVGADCNLPLVRNFSLAIGSIGLVHQLFYFFLCKNYRDNPPS